MVLSAILPEQWLYGFAATVMTHNPFFAIALQAAVFLSATWFFWHRNDPPPLDAHVHITQPALTWMGALVGMFFVAFFRSPRFVTTRLFNSNGQFMPWFFLLIVFVMGIIAGVYHLEAGETDLGWALTISFGIAALFIVVLYGVSQITVVRGGEVVKGLTWLTIPEDGIAQLKYLFLFSLVAILPAANDYPLTIGGVMGPQDIRPWNAVIFSLALVVVFVIFYALTVLHTVSGGVPSGGIDMPRREKYWWADRRDSRGMKRDFVLAFFAAIVIVYIPALIVDQVVFDIYGTPASGATPADMEQQIWAVVTSVGVSSAVILLIIAVWAWLREWQPLQMSSGWDAGAGKPYGTSVRGTEEGEALVEY